MRFQAPPTAVVLSDPTRSPLGDQRERAVPCQRCRRPTWNIDAFCDDCRLQPCAVCGDRATSGGVPCSQCAERDEILLRGFGDTGAAGVGRAHGGGLKRRRGFGFQVRP